MTTVYLNGDFIPKARAAKKCPNSCKITSIDNPSKSWPAIISPFIFCYSFLFLDVKIFVLLPIGWQIYGSQRRFLNNCLGLVVL